MSTASGTSNYHWHTHLTWLQDLVTDTWERSQKGQQMSVSSRSIVTASNKLNQYTRAPVLKTVITSSTDHDLLYQIRLCHGDLLNIKHNFIDTWTRNTTVRYWCRNKEKPITSYHPQCNTELSATPWHLQFHQLLLHTKPRSPAGLGCTGNITFDHLVFQMLMQMQHRTVLLCMVQCTGHSPLLSCATMLLNTLASGNNENVSK